MAVKKYRIGKKLAESAEAQEPVEKPSGEYDSAACANMLRQAADAIESGDDTGAMDMIVDALEMLAPSDESEEETEDMAEEDDAY